MIKTQDRDCYHNYIYNYLNAFSKIAGYDNMHPNIFLYGKSAYVLGQNIVGRVEFLENKFNDIVKIPFGKDFEYSVNADSIVISEEIVKANKLCRSYCDSLIYVNRVAMIDFINKHYNSLAKLKKITVTFSTDPFPRFIFKPRKKSVSVFENEFLPSGPIRVCSNYRVSDGSLSIDGVCFYEVLNNELLDDVIRVEANYSKGFLRVGCIYDGVKIKFVIKNKR